MTTPASGAISLSNINTEVGAASNTNRSLDWVKTNTKDAVAALGSVYNRAWYQKNNAGNCNNGNCTSNCNCGFSQCNCACKPNVNADCWGHNYGNCPAGGAVCLNCNCSNCTACTAVNCTNCDARAWLQSNCNCACTYNCNITGGVSYNCGNCACLCINEDCNCAC